MERGSEHRLSGGVESMKKKRVHCMQPLLAALGGPLGQAGGV